MALPKKHRITKKRDIDYVFKKGRTIRGDFLFLKFLKNKDGFPRFSFIISSKNVPLAVHRNRIKRLFSAEIINKPSFLGLNYDVVAVVNKKITKNKTESLINEFGQLLSEINVSSQSGR